MISYAQNFEDVMLARALGDRAAGFYVDVGACHPDQASVTRHFYELGWSGINVEPMQAPFAELRAARPRDVNVHAAIASYDGELAIYEGTTVGESSALRPYATARPTLVPCMTLASLCRAHVTRPIDFLKIDVEGLEQDVIASGDWSAFRPAIVVIEVTVPWTTRRRDDARAITDLMIANRYDEVYFDGLNAFFVAREVSSLAERFAAPPNVLDRFVLASEAAQAAEANRLQAHTDAVERRIGEVREHSERVAQRLAEVQSYAERQRALLDASEQAARGTAARESELRSEIAAAGKALEAMVLRAQQSREILQRRLARTMQRSQAQLARLRDRSNARVARVIRAARRNALGLAQALHQSRATADAASSRAQVAEAQAADWQARLRDAEQALAQANAEFRHAASVAGQAHAQLAQIEARERVTLQRALQAEHTVGSMLGSRSWRITAPLRALGKLFQGAAGPEAPTSSHPGSRGALRAAALRRGRLLARRTPLYHWLAPRLKARYPALWARARSVVVEHPAPPASPSRAPDSFVGQAAGTQPPADEGRDSVAAIAARIREDVARRRGA